MSLFKDIRGFVVCGFVLLAVFLLIPAMSQGLTVTNLNNAGAGSLRDAVVNTPGGGTVDFAVTGVITLSSEIVIDKSLTIQGPGADQLTVSGGNTTRVFHVTVAADFTINAIKIANGFDNNALAGAVMLIESTNVNMELNDCSIEDNVSSPSGPGLGVISYPFGSASIKVNRCSFTNNSTVTTGFLPAGGGVFGTGSGNNSLEVNDSSFTSNLAQSESGPAIGGVVGAGGSPNVHKFNNCTFDSNRAIGTGNIVIGGAVGDGASNAFEFTNCTFYGNSAECNGSDCNFVVGGAIGSNGDSDIKCDFCTFVSNSISCMGGSCSIVEGNILTALSSNSNIEISNSIIEADDPTNSCSGPVVSLGYNIDNGNSCVGGGAVGDKPITNPDLSTPWDFRTTAASQRL